MTTIEIPREVQAGFVQNIIKEKGGSVRFSELAEQFDGDSDSLRLALFELVEDGEVAIFPIGNVVQVREE